MSDSGQSPKYQKNTKEQYEALGRFVEAFELMVDEVRTTCIKLMGPTPNIFDSTLPEIAFHHQVMTAKPLFEIMRAMIAQLIKDPDAVEDEERPIFSGVLAQISKGYTDLTNMRNNLLHGTWFVGYVTDTGDDAEEFHVRKNVATKDGLAALDLPKTATELLDEAQKCEQLRDWLRAIQDCIPLVGTGSSIERRFKFNGKAWELRPYWKLPPSQQKRTKGPG
jgi:hypothetical protein